MKYFLNRLTIVAMLLLVGACSSVNTEPKNPKSSLVEASKPKLDKGLCQYSLHKGIAELVSTNESAYRFMFFPGNIEFEISYRDIDKQLEIGSEYKALFEELVQGGPECRKPTPQLIELPH